jgi:AcrR family transcriptional regulator
MILTENKKQIAREKSIERIRNSAIQLFSKHGFSATTMEMIAKQAKVSKGLAYNYFKSKNQIFELIVDQHLSRQEVLYRTIDPNQSALDYLREFFTKSIDFFEKERKTFILISVCLFQPNSVALSRKLTEGFEKRLAPFKEAVCERFKLLGVEDPETEMLFVRIFLHGFFTLQCAHVHENIPKEKLIEIFLFRYSDKRFVSECRENLKNKLAFH